MITQEDILKVTMNLPNLNPKHKIQIQKKLAELAKEKSDREIKIQKQLASITKDRKIRENKK
jgi:hypothetical protein